VPRLTQQQESLTANLNQTTAEQEDTLTPVVDTTDIEAKIRALGLSRDQEDALIQVRHGQLHLDNKLQENPLLNRIPCYI